MSFRYFLSAFLWLLFFVCLFVFLKDIKDKLWKKEEEEATPKIIPPLIEGVINRREWFLQKMKDAERMRELSFKYPNLNQDEIKGELMAEKCFSKYVSLGNLSVGCADDYFDFLDSYVEHGGSATHHYENNINKSLKENENKSQEIYIARNEIEIFPAHGSPGKIIIVMPGCTVIHGYQACNAFYCYDNISNQKYAFWIPTFKDWLERWKACI